MLLPLTPNSFGSNFDMGSHYQMQKFINLPTSRRGRFLIWYAGLAIDLYGVKIPHDTFLSRSNRILTRLYMELLLLIRLRTFGKVVVSQRRHINQSWWVRYDKSKLYSQGYVVSQDYTTLIMTFSHPLGTNFILKAADIIRR